MKNKKIILLISLLITSVFFQVTNFKVNATSKYGITLQVDKSNDVVNDAITFSFTEYTINASHIGIKINPSLAIDNKGNVPSWTMLQLKLTDIDNNTYTMTQTNGETTSSNVTLPSFDSYNNYLTTTYGYSYIWPKLGFYGTIYIPYEEFLLKGKPISKGSKIKSVTIQHNSKSNSRTNMTTNLFELCEADITIPDNSSSWIGDVHLLASFDKIVGDDLIKNYTQILDFSKISDSAISKADNVTMYTKDFTKEEYDNLIASLTDENVAWKNMFTTTGQKFNYSPINNKEYKEAVYWQYGMYFEEYDSNLNSYGSIAINSSFTNWENALGLTIYVENLQSYPASFNLEFAEKEDGGLERWNLNSDYYRRVYAYDINTNEEFAFNTLTVILLPANFKGWLRIPFSEYQVPSWSAAFPYNDSILSLNKPHPTIYITSQFVKNDSCGFIFDNVGLFYEEFQVGKLFDRTKKSIKECLEIKDYVIGGNN